jgi:hypothetical protein
MIENALQELKTRIVLFGVEDDGMSTAEYAIGTIAAAAFGAVLYTVVTKAQVRLLACRPT